VERFTGRLCFQGGLANAERIAYLLGRKSRDVLSANTDPQKLDIARQELKERVASLSQNTLWGRWFGAVGDRLAA